MSDHSAIGFEVSTDDEAFDLLLDEIGQRLKQGEGIDVDACVAQHPEFADQLRRVLPGMQALAELGHVQTVDHGLPEDGSTSTTRTLGDYQIIREIGRGGMGVVYEAEQLSLERRVALKVLPFAAVLDERQIRRFKNEALAAAQLDHPHIVNVYGVGCERAVHFYAMRYVEGHSLAEVIAQLRESSKSMEVDSGTELDAETDRHSPVRRQSAALVETGALKALSTEAKADTREFFRSAARIGIEVAQALDHAHQQGVVHRDVKPANVIIDAAGKAWVTDFGLAHLETGATLTMTGDLVGTLRYMSPEQALAKRVVVDHRTDVYSLGVTLYELLTLRPAFPDQDRQDLLRKIAFEDPPSPNKINRRVPHELETIVLKAISKNPAHRYETAQDLADDLQRFLNDEPIRARRPTLWQRAAKWRRRHRMAVTAAAIVFVAALVMLAVGLAVNSHLIALERDNAREGWDEADAATIAAKHQLYEARLAQARAGRRSGRIGQRFDSLRALEEAIELADELELGERAAQELRNEAVGCLALFDAQLIRECELIYSDGNLVFDAGLEHYALSDAPGRISICGVNDDRETSILAVPNGTRHALASGAGFSPNGDLLASYAFGHVSPVAVVWDWRQQQLIFRSPLSDNLPHASCFSPNSRLFAIGRPGGQVVVYELATGTEFARLETGAEPHNVRFSPDGSQLAVGSFNGSRVQIHDLPSGALLRTIPAPHGAWKAAWHPNGRVLAVSSNDFHVRIWDTVTGHELAVLRGHQSVPHGLSFSHDGEFLSTWGFDGTVRLWDPHAGQEFLRISGTHGQLSTDGQRLICRRGPMVQFWRVTNAAGHHPLARHSASTSVPISYFNPGDISPDGRLLAIPGRHHDVGGVGLFDLNRREAAAYFGLEGTEHVLFHPSGEELFTAGTTGLYRWPFQDTDRELRVGPPQKLVSGTRGAMAIDPQGRFLVCAVWDDGVAEVISLDQHPTTVKRLAHGCCESVAISADSRWIATGTRNGRGVKVWDAASGELVNVLMPNAGNTTIRFLPENGHLLTNQGHGFLREWSTESWELVGEIPCGSGGMASEGRLLTSTTLESHIQLHDVVSGCCLATLEAPDQQKSSFHILSPGGCRLVTYDVLPASLRVWDLRQLRAELAESGLDWDAPPYPPRDDDKNHGAPVRVDVDLGEFADLSVQQ